MGRDVGAVDQGVVQVRDGHRGGHPVQHEGNKAAVGGRAIGEAEGEGPELVGAEWGGERRFGAILFSEWYHMEGPVGIKGAEDLAVRQPAQIVRYVWNGMRIALRDAIQLAIVDAPADAASFLWGRNERETPR